MRPSGLVAVLNDIVINNRSRIVECGSGISTFYIGRLLQERGGHLYTVEHDADWADLLQRALAQEDLSEYVTVVYAPLKEDKHTWNGATWYDEEKLGCIKTQGKIDLLVVDGPPGYSTELMYARYPAVPYFKDASPPITQLCLMTSTGAGSKRYSIGGQANSASSSISVRRWHNRAGTSPTFIFGVASSELSRITHHPTK